ncbi:ATP-dependent DNA ligase [Paenibacillus glycanilyticus]|uniref:ATP-dependent DNA ligase n=1 Tax=Paenibacillus glycanilyticus TaxID=126569 RepID=UPI0037C9F2E6
MKDGDSIKLWTRHENDVTQKYPELHTPSLNCTSCILDGEVAYIDPATGMIDFESVMERFRMTKLPTYRTERSGSRFNTSFLMC